MDPLELFAMHASELDRLQIGYFVTGSVATMAFGEMRQTADIDVVVHLEHEDAEAICACFPEPEFYVSLKVVERAIARADQFNVLHPSSGFKLDFMVSSLSESIGPGSPARGRCASRAGSRSGLPRQRM